MNPVNRRLFLGLLGASAATVTVAGCAGSGGSGGDSSGGSSGGGGAEGAAGTITFWSNHPGNSKDVETQLIDTFQKENSGLTVNLVDGGKNYEEVAQKLNAALTGNDVPDVVVVSDVTWFNFALNDQIAPLDDLFSKAGVDTKEYVDALVGDYVLEGQTFGLPYARSTPLFYYNKQVWEAAGLPDRGPESWDEFMEWAPAIQKAIGDGKHAIAMYDGSNYLDWTMQNMIWDNGGAYSQDWEATFTDPGTIAGVERLKKINDDGFLVVSKDSITEFASGLAACAMASTGSLKTATENAKFEFGTAFLPGARANSSCPTGGAGLAIPAKLSEERKINALKFINSITSTQSTAIFAQATGYMPVRKGAKEAQEIKGYLESTPQAATAIEQLEFTRPQDNARVFVPNGGARIGGGLDKVLAGQPIAEVMEQLQTETQQIIDTQIAPKLG